MQRSAKIPTMGCTWRTAHCRDFLLAAADDPLSQDYSQDSKTQFLVRRG